MLDYNNPKTGDRRSKAKELTLQEEERVIEIINERLKLYSPSKENEELLEKFMDRYQYYAAYLASTRGLRCTEHPDKVIDPKNTLFPLQANNTTRPMPLYEEEEVVNLLNAMLDQYPVAKAEKELLQRFLDHYQNIANYHAYTGGELQTGASLWCTEHRDSIDDPEKTAFKLGFGDDPVEGGEYSDKQLEESREKEGPISNFNVDKDGNISEDDERFLF